MKGMAPIEALGIVLIAIVVLVTVFNFFSGPAEAAQQKPIAAGGECKTRYDCADNENGPICVTSGNPVPVRFCGCIDDADCSGKTCAAGVDYKCH